jgi:thiamine-phosphate pyrophosphorylase
MSDEQGSQAPSEDGKVEGAAAAPAAKGPRLILVTDPTYADDRILDVVKACCGALPRGAFGVQLRDKKKEAVPLRAFAERLREATKESGSILLINGNPELAKAVGADGVHLGGDAIKVQDARAILGEKSFVTIAAHSDQAVKLGSRDGADGALVSAIFASPGKVAGRGVDALRSARVVAREGFAIYALGGVERANAAECFQAGADGVAVIRALLLASDPAAEARALHDAQNAT